MTESGASSDNVGRGRPRAGPGRAPGRHAPARPPLTSALASLSCQYAAAALHFLLSLASPHLLPSTSKAGAPPLRRREIHHAQLSQTLCHYLLYALHTLAEPVGSQEKSKRSFLLHRHARSSANLAVHRGRSNAVLLYAPRGLFHFP
jgi:hypothetical protein